MQTSYQFFQPVRLVGYSGPGEDSPDNPSDDTKRYGFELDLTTSVYYYTYDWGYGFVVRILGFGVNICRYGF